MNPTKLAGAVAGSAEHPEHFAIEVEFVDAPRITIGCKEHLVWTGRDADCPRRAVELSLVHGCRSFGGGGNLRRRIPHPWTDLVVVGHGDVNFAQILAVSIEDLDAAIAAVGDVHIARIIRGHSPARPTT